MPRKSAAELSVIRLSPAATRLQTPATLVGAERDVFAAVIANNAPDQFRLSDLPMLESYCSVVIQLQRCREQLRGTIVTDDGKLSPWVLAQERGIKALMGLSMKLRLSPQDRTAKPGPKVVQPSVYSLMRAEAEDE
jgi:phage terminase small subunit